MTIQKALNWAETRLKVANITASRLDSQILLQFVIRQERSWLLANLDQKISNLELSTYQKLIARRVNREPIVHLTGSREFYGLDFTVNADVLTPRAETEVITDLAIKYAPKSSNLIDIGTGCGAIAIAIAKHRPDLEVWATEISRPALQVAQKNSSKHKTTIKFIESDLFSALDGYKFHTIVTNLPYLVDNIELMPEVKREPAVALFGGPGDGLDLYRRFLSQLPAYLQPDGYLFTECDPWQQPELIKAAAGIGLSLIKEDYFVLGFRRPQ